MDPGMSEMVTFYDAAGNPIEGPVKFTLAQLRYFVRLGVKRPLLSERRLVTKG